MSKKRLVLKIVVIVIIALEVIISAGCNISNYMIDINNSNGATTTTDINSLNNIDINSFCGRIGESSGKLYLLSDYSFSDGGLRGTIWADGEKLVDGEMFRLYVDNGNVYFIDRNGMNKSGAEGVSQVLEKDLFTNTVVYNDKIYYRDLEKYAYWYCYNMIDRTNSFVTNGTAIEFCVNSDYIVYWNYYDVFILDASSYAIIKEMHFKNSIVGCSLDKDNVYYLEMIPVNSNKQKFKITKYNIKQDMQTTVFDTNENEMIAGISAIDDKIVFEDLSDNQFGIRYIDMRTMENKFFTLDIDIAKISASTFDILFDGQQIIYEKDQTFYSISIFTGETKKIELNG